ncbi:MAG: phenylalanine--tRNA ligase subunit beta [Planctomycetes bacterium]|nr:phenylalanine--tRNA ligase subunit beta [Planctomycetota bacterium]
MKFTYNWLKEFCDFKLNPDELADLLTNHGLKIESYATFQDSQLSGVPAAQRSGMNADMIYELEITANRADCLSIVGIAREVALLTGTHLKPLRIKEEKKNGKGNFIRTDDPALCPLYIGRIIKGIRVGSSPEWMRKRLEAIGIRPVNNIVDITNYVLYETGQPLHAFDLNKLAGKEIIVRKAKAGEKIKAIDDKEYSLSPEMLVIADSSVPVAIAGVMGGKATEISYGTTDLLLESAAFNPANVRKTSRQLKLASDSSYRFERGINPFGTEEASLRATALIKEFVGGSVTGCQEVNHLNQSPKKISLRLSRAEDILGVIIDKEEIKRILKGLGFIIKKEFKGAIEMISPAYRLDIEKEVDIIEELVRVIGYDKIPVELPQSTGELKAVNKSDIISAQLKPLLAGGGFNEILTNSFLEEKYQEDFPLWTDKKPLGLLNPDGVEDRFLRKSLLPSLLMAQKTSQGYNDEGDSFSSFEIASCYYPENDKPGEKHVLSLLDTRSFYSLKGMIAKICAEFKLDSKIKIVPAQADCFGEGKSFKILLNDQSLGWAGELSDKLMDKYELRKKPVLAELDFDLFVKNAALAKVFSEFSRFPAIKRDLAMIFDRTALWEKIEEAVRQVAPEFLEKIKFFDLYEGKNIPPGKKSLAFSLVFRSDKRTLTNSEVDEAVNKIVKHIGTKFGASLREA